MAVLMGRMVARSVVQDNATLNLNGAAGVQTLTVGGRTFVYAAGQFDWGISSFELKPNGTLTSVQNIQEGSQSGLELNGAANFATASVGGNTYLYVNSAIYNGSGGLNTFRVAADGRLTLVSAIADNGTYEILESLGRMTVTSVIQPDGTRGQYLVASGRSDHGFSVFRIGANGVLQPFRTVSDDSDPRYALRGAMDTATAIIDGKTFIFVAGEYDGGINSFELSVTGVTFRDSVTDSDPAYPAGLELAGASGLATLRVGGVTYLAVASTYDDAISIFSVSATGQLVRTSQIKDSAALGLDGARGVTSFTLGGETFVSVSGLLNDALGVFHVGVGGKLTNVTTMFDTAAVALGSSFYSSFTVVNGVPFLLASGHDNTADGGQPGLTVFELGGGADTLNGTANADVLLGLGANDVLNGGGAADRLWGGAGNDLLAGGAGVDVLQGQAGADRLVGGAGRDRVTGGAGSDTFQFNNRAEGGDIVTDFGNGAGNNDVFRISAAGFGGGLVGGRQLAASQFQSRGDNLAQDSNDRFIFRTTDKTLWFDADGQGGAAAVLVADLQAGAVVTAADIFLF